MMTPDKGAPAPSWELMGQAKDLLGMAALQKIFSVGRRQIARYCAHPEWHEQPERNPIDRLRLLLTALVRTRTGRGERTADGILTALAEPLGRGEGLPETVDAVTLGEAFGDVAGAVGALRASVGLHPQFVAGRVREIEQAARVFDAAYRRAFARDGVDVRMADPEAAAPDSGEDGEAARLALGARPWWRRMRRRLGVWLCG